MNTEEAQEILDAMVKAADEAGRRRDDAWASVIKRWRTKPPSWEQWPRKVHKAVAAMCAARDGIKCPRVSVQAACDVIWDRYKVAICASTLDRYCRIVLGRRSFAKPAHEDVI